MSKTAAKESLTGPTRCPLCQEHYQPSTLHLPDTKQKQSNKRPLILTGCGHTFCEDCLLQGILAEDKLLHGDSLELKCSKCKASTHCRSVSELPVNRCILEFLELSWNRPSSGDRGRRQSQRPWNETENEGIDAKILKEFSSNDQDSDKFEKRLEQTRVSLDVFPRRVCPSDARTSGRTRSRRISVTSFPLPDSLETITSGYSTMDNMEKRRSRSFSNEPCLDMVTSSTPNIPSCPEFDEGSIPKDSAHCNVLWNRMSGFPHRPLAFNPNFVPSMKTSQGRFDDGRKLSSLDNKENSNTGQIQKFKLPDREHQTLTRPKKCHFPRKDFFSTIVYHSKLNRAMQCENDDLVSPTRLAVTSDGGTLALVDEPSHSVHVITIRSGQKRLIRVDDVRSCCFLTDLTMVVTTSGGIKLFNVFGHLLNEVALDAWPSTACVSMSGKRVAVAFPQHVSIYSFEKSCFPIKKIKSKILTEVGHFMTFSKKKSTSIGFQSIVDLAWNSHCKHFDVLEIVSNGSLAGASASQNLGNNRKRSGNSEDPKHLVSVFDENGSLLATLTLLTSRDDSRVMREPHYVALGRELDILITSRERGIISKYTLREGSYSTTPSERWSVSHVPTATSKSTANLYEVRGLFLSEHRNSVYVFVLGGEQIEVRTYNI